MLTCEKLYMSITFSTLQSHSLFNINKLFGLIRISYIMSNHKRKHSEIDAEFPLIEELTARVEKVERKILKFTKELGEIKMLLTKVQASKQPLRQASTEIDGPNIQNLCQQEFLKENGYVVVYTDGACENNGKPNARAGIGVYFGAGSPLNVSQPVVGRATNNTAEIQACTRALKIAHEQGIKKLKIKTDSQFVISSITQWIHRWKKNNWKVASGGDVKNKEDFVVLDSSQQLLEDVQWEHIDGHKGHLGNEEADRLARRGAQSYKS